MFACGEVSALKATAAKGVSWAREGKHLRGGATALLITHGFADITAGDMILPTA